MAKYVFRYSYVHVSGLTSLPSEDQQRVSRALTHVGLVAVRDFHVVKLARAIDEVSFLAYPTFFEEPFPVLTRSWRVRLLDGCVTVRDYESSLNPPILHRKELLLLPDHPLHLSCRKLTAQAEQLGLFDDPVRIGFKLAWEALIAERGYVLHDGCFVPLPREGTSDDVMIDARLLRSLEDASIKRHRTALSRNHLSAPVQALLRHGFLNASRFLDYGCGRGDDVRALLALGVPASGWDPHFAPDAPRQATPVVNLGFCQAIPSVTR